MRLPIKILTNKGSFPREQFAFLSRQKNESVGLVAKSESFGVGEVRRGSHFERKRPERE